MPQNHGWFSIHLEKSCRSAIDPIAVVLHLVITLRMKSHPTNIIAAMLEMLLVFESVCKDVETLQRLIKMASDREKWEDGHSLFQDIRQKTLWAEKHGDPLVKTQYAFEEICAKTLYNLSGCNAPFDADSAFWVVPLGVALGRELGFSEPSQVSTLLEM
jgi:hypothetical protein